MPSKEKHIAGIVPIAGQRRADYVFPWHDCLMPLNKDYYAIERAVYECAVVGCDAVWIVSDLEFSRYNSPSSQLFKVFETILSAFLLSRSLF